MAARPDEVQTGLRILARMIAEAYLKDLARRNSTHLSAINEDNREIRGPIMKRKESLKANVVDERKSQSRNVLR